MVEWSQVKEALPSVVSLLGVGAGGILELQQHLDDASVCWALLRFDVGRGTFARSKLVAIKCNGERVPVMTRGKMNALAPKVHSLFGDVHATIEVSTTKEITAEGLCTRLMSVFRGDDLRLSAQEMKEEYEKRLGRERSKSFQLDGSPPLQVARHRPEDTVQTLEAVSKDRGQYNWALLNPRTLDVQDAGYGGLEEMRSYLKEDEVLFGALRLNFGLGSEGPDQSTSQRGLTKHLFVHWVGPKVSVVKRGLSNARMQEASDKISSFCFLTLRKEAHCNQDLDLASIIADLRRLTVTDAVGQCAADWLSVEEYNASLDYEDRCRALTESDVSSPLDAAELPDAGAAVEHVRKSEGSWNWMLIGAKSSGQRR
jgi:hypothetical protein